MFINLFRAIVITTLCFVVIQVSGQDQVGQTLYGLGEYRNFGYVVDINDSGDNIMVRNDVIGGYRATTRVYNLENDEWTQKGVDDNPAIRFGMALSSDGDQLLCGADVRSGQRLDWDGIQWVNLRSEIAMDNYVVDGSSSNDMNVISLTEGLSFLLRPPGKCSSVFEWNGTDWVRLGAEFEDAQLLKLSGDGEIACTSTEDGVQCYRWTGTNWNNYGQLILNFLPSGQSVYKLSLSDSGDRIAVRTSRGTVWEGAVYTYEMNNGSWQEMDSPIEHQLPGLTRACHPSSISLSSNGQTLGISFVPFHNNAGAGPGPFFPYEVHLYDYDGSSWILNDSIHSDVTVSYVSPIPISLSDNRRVVVGLPTYDGETGRAKVFEFCSRETTVDAVTACDEYTWINGVTYYESQNSIQHTIDQGNQCDSFVELDLTINYSTISTDVVEACEEYTWINGVTYYESVDSVQQTLQTANGCDSIIELDLTIHYGYSSVDVVEACEEFTWIDGVTYSESNNTATHIIINSEGCEDIFELDLTIHDRDETVDHQVHCGSYTWINGVTYTEDNNTAMDTLSNINGCDSVVTLDLIIRDSSSSMDLIESCRPYTWIDGVTYTEDNNTAMDTLVNAAGCDSVVTLNLTMLEQYSSMDRIESCGPYTWIDGETYTENNNTAQDILISVDGCDSIITLDLTIYEQSMSVDRIESCGSYTWIDGETYTENNNTAQDTLISVDGCDSIITLDLTIYEQSMSVDRIESCGPYTWINDETYTESNNTASVTLTNSVGCDSVVELDLNIISLNTSVDVNGATLDAAEENATYQWLDCDNNFTAIPGAVSKSYIATESGRYAVLLTEEICTDTSDCYSIVVNSVIELTDLPELIVFPNPSTDLINVTLNKPVPWFKTNIYDAVGQLISAEISSTTNTVLRLPEINGVYFIEVYDHQGRRYTARVLRL